MRRLFVMIALPLAFGCRVPSIPAQPSPQEYEVYSAWIEQASPQFPHQLAFAVNSKTMTLQQNELQFRQCLPRRMDAIFDTAATANLVSTSANDWLNLSDGRPARLYGGDAPLSFDRPTEVFQFSRVAFTRFGYDAYLWVEHRTCTLGNSSACVDESGALVHGVKSDGAWTFEKTICQTIAFPA